MQKERVLEILKGMTRQTALVVGDIILDGFIYGSVERISREAPAPILSQKRHNYMLGGAGNLARNIKSLGGKTILVGVVGDDREGHLIEGLAQESFLDNAQIIRIPNYQTPTKLRYISKAQQMFCVDRDPVSILSAEDESHLVSTVCQNIHKCDIVILSDYGRGSLSRTGIRSIIKRARKLGKLITVDPRGRDYTRYNGANLIKPNLDELATETEKTIVADASVECALRTLKVSLSQVNAILVTRGPDGMSLIDQDDKICHHRSRERQVFDVSGAGDTVLAAVSLAYSSGLGLSECMSIGDLAAGCVISKPGTAIVKAHEILEDASVGTLAPNWRIVSRKEVSKLSSDWKNQGFKVGFTNGCFDMLHAGHLSVLRFAAASCDRLIVGLNSDVSVARLKGKDRPINDEGHRAIILASLEMVDRVVLFHEDTPENLLRAIMPHVMIKGSDYKIEGLPGADIIQREGGEILFAPFIENMSTTNLVDKIKS